MTEDFRRGILYAFATSGLTPEDVGNLVLTLGHEKVADMSGGGGLFDSLFAAGVGLPLGFGALGGAGAYTMFGPNYKTNINTMRMQDILNEIKQKRRDAARNMAQKANPSI